MTRPNSSARTFSTDQLRAALGEVGGSARPDYLADIVSQASRTRQRPAWTDLARWISTGSTLPRQGVPRAAAALTTLVLLVALLTAAAVYVGSVQTRTDRLPDVPLGVFEPAAGRIVFGSTSLDPDRGYGGGLWAVDPSAPSVSTLVRIGPEGNHPIGWSGDGTRLLVRREDQRAQDCCPDLLVILQADGSETQLNRDALYTYGATIAPDGSRVVFAAGDYRGDPGVFVVDAFGGQPVQIAAKGESPTFSPDGRQIAYLVSGSTAWVVVANADGSDPRNILLDEPALLGGVGGSDLAWSPAGDRIAIGINIEGRVAIYTFAPDGSEFTAVVTGGRSPSWSPDGSRIAYSIFDDPVAADGLPHLAIADADGSDVLELDFGASGPWHPRILAAAD